MDAETLKNRTKAFALRVIRLTEALPPKRAADVIGRQLLRCGTSVGANYRAACCARSPAEFVAKLGIVEEEVDEAIYWMELLVEAELVNRMRIEELINEAQQLRAITIASIRTSRSRANRARGR